MDERYCNCSKRHSDAVRNEMSISSRCFFLLSSSHFWLFGNAITQGNAMACNIATAAVAVAAVAAWETSKSRGLDSIIWYFIKYLCVVHAFVSSNHEYQLELQRIPRGEWWLIGGGDGKGDGDGRQQWLFVHFMRPWWCWCDMDSNLGAAFNQSMQFELSAQWVYTSFQLRTRIRWTNYDDVEIWNCIWIHK